MTLHRRAFLRQLGAGTAGFGLASFGTVSLFRRTAAPQRASAQHAGSAGRVVIRNSEIPGRGGKVRARIARFHDGAPWPDHRRRLVGAVWSRGGSPALLAEQKLHVDRRGVCRHGREIEGRRPGSQVLSGATSADGQRPSGGSARAASPCHVGRAREGLNTRKKWLDKGNDCARPESVADLT